MFRVKRYVVKGLTSHKDLRLTVTSVEPYVAATDDTLTKPATADSIPWKHYAKARSRWSVRRASIKAHDAYVAAEIALCGHDLFASSGSTSRTDAGF